MPDRDLTIARLAGQVRGLEAVVQALVSLIPMVGADSAGEITRRSRSMAQLRRTLMEEAKRSGRGIEDPQMAEALRQAMVRTVDRAFSSAMDNMEKVAAMQEGAGKPRQ